MGFMAQKEFILCPKVVNFIANLKNEAKYDGSLVYFDLYCLRHFQKLKKKPGARALAWADLAFEFKSEH